MSCKMNSCRVAVAGCLECFGGALVVRYTPSPHMRDDASEVTCQGDGIYPELSVFYSQP